MEARRKSDKFDSLKFRKLFYAQTVEKLSQKTNELYLWVYHILVIHSSVDVHAGCFHLFLAMINNAALNIPIQIFVGIDVFISFSYILEVDLLGHLVTVQYFEELPNCFSNWLYHFRIPPTMYEVLIDATTWMNF